MRQCFCIPQKEKTRNKIATFSCAKFTVIEQIYQKYGGEWRKMFILWKNISYGIRKRAYKKAYFWSTDYCTVKQNTKGKNVQQSMFKNIQTSLCPEIKHGYQTPLQSNLSWFASVLMTFRNWSKLIISIQWFCFLS